MSGHRDGDESQQKDEHPTTQWQDDWDQRNNRFDCVNFVFLFGFGGSGHGAFLTLRGIQLNPPLFSRLARGRGILRYFTVSRFERR
jgi:hypothetical protein